MTNKLKYFIGNWKMFGDFGSFKIINKVNKFRRMTKINVAKILVNKIINNFEK